MGRTPQPRRLTAVPPTLSTHVATSSCRHIINSIRAAAVVPYYEFPYVHSPFGSTADVERPVQPMTHDSELMMLRSATVHLLGPVESPDRKFGYLHAFARGRGGVVFQPDQQGWPLSAGALQAGWANFSPGLYEASRSAGSSKLASSRSDQRATTREAGCHSPTDLKYIDLN